MTSNLLFSFNVNIYFFTVDGDVEGKKSMNDDEKKEIAELNAVKRRARRSQALRKNQKNAINDIRNGGRGTDLKRQTSVIEGA